MTEDDDTVFSHIRPIDRAAVKISCDPVPDSDVHKLTAAYLTALSDPARHQVSELNALNCAIAGERPGFCPPGDSGGVSFRYRICLYSTSVQQIRATPNVPNADPSRR